MAPKLTTRRLAILFLIGALATPCIFLLQGPLVDAKTPSTFDAVSSSLSTFGESPNGGVPISVHGDDDKEDSRNPAAKGSVCGGCQHAVANVEENLRCGFLIQELQTKHGLSLGQAIENISQDYPKACSPCLPEACSAAEKMYWRYDLAAPRVQRGYSHRLQSIPETHRVPSHAVDNVTSYFSDPQHVYPEREYLFEYNPSIVRLPKSQRTIVDGAVYLASFRVSNQHYCFPPSVRKLVKQKPPPKNLLGLALLRMDMTVITDVVVDLKKARFHSAEDFRLFVLRDQLYVSSYDQITPLWLVPPVDAIDLFTLPTIFGDLTVSVRYFPSCAPCEKKNGYCGKNVNFLVDGATDKALVEIWPSAPHLLRTLDLDAPCRRNETPATFIDDSPAPRPSFATVEEVLFPSLDPTESLLTRGRGGACCTPIQHPVTNHTLWMGIQHSKTPQQRNKRLPKGNVTPNHYLSSIYVFEAKEPYRLVAQSGLFCLGFPDKAEQEANPLARATTWRKLILGQEFDCPRIHFVSGMTLKEDDSSTAIIAYGINDCVSRLVEISVFDLVRLAFAELTPLE